MGVFVKMSKDRDFGYKTTHGKFAENYIHNISEKKFCKCMHVSIDISILKNLRLKLTHTDSNDDLPWPF